MYVPKDKETNKQALFSSLSVGFSTALGLAIVLYKYGRRNDLDFTRPFDFVGFLGALLV